MSIYSAPSNNPTKYYEFQTFVLDQFREIANAFASVETDAVLLKQWNAEPDKTYDGLVVYADGTNWNPGSGEGVYCFYNSSWNKLG